MKIPTSLLKAIDTLPLNTVSIGSSEIILFKSKDLISNQVGYRSHGQTGESLIGKSEGDWLEDWFVIGYDSLCGDPLFVDVSDSNLPVMTAMHGEGAWNPETIATTLAGFSEGLLVLATLSKGREHPVGLESHPISEKERTDFLAKMRPLVGVGANYWSILTRETK